MSSINILKQGILSVDCECIVNAANSHLAMGGGVCGIIFNAAGAFEMQMACNRYDGCPTGGAVITPGFNLRQNYVIHAVGPVYQGGNYNEDKLLYSAYKQSLLLAAKHNIHSITFPLISAGIFGYPVDGAWRKALQACNDFISHYPTYDMTINFAVIDDTIYEKGLATYREVVSN